MTTENDASGQAPPKDRTNDKIFRLISIVAAVALIVATAFLADQVAKDKVKLDFLEQSLRHAWYSVQKSMWIPQEVVTTPASCTTRQCIISAATLIESLDESVDPCQDFYQFACGGWQKKNPLPETASRLLQFDKLDVQVDSVLLDILREDATMSDSKAVNDSKEMFQACVNFDRIEELGLQPLTELIESYGHWPMTVSNWSDDSFNWQRTIASINRQLGEEYLISIYNYMDSDNTKINIIYVDQPNIELQPYWSRSVSQAYRTYAVEAAKAVRDHFGHNVNDSEIEGEVEHMIAFEVELSKILYRPEESRDMQRMMNRFQVSELQNWTDSVGVLQAHARIDWLMILNEIYSNVGYLIKEGEQMIVMETDYLIQMVGLLNRTDSRIVANYIHWRLVMKFGVETNRRMLSMASEFYRVLRGPSQSGSRLRWCVDKTHESMGFAISKRYVERSFDEEAKTQTEQMIGYLKVAFSSLVEEASWMDEETKLQAKKKAAAMKEMTAYPQWFHNDTALDSFYDGLLVSKETHFDNVKNTYEFFMKKQLKQLRGKTDRDRWLVYPSIVNAFYFPFLNSIHFPAAILQPPFFAKGRLAASNYGAVGMVIGHEITHAFDDQGRQRDADGQLASWWTNETLDRYLERAQCFINQYSNYSFTQLDGPNATHINGIISQGENIADNGGLRQAYRAYKNYIAVHGDEQLLPGLERYSGDQLFFISYANVWCGHQNPVALRNQILNGPHSPARYRVIGPLSNSVDFAREFQCEPGQMNRPDKCILW